MKRDFNHAGASVPALTLDDVSSTFRNSLASDEPPAILATLLSLIPCTPNAMARSPIQLIDRERGLLRVPDPKGELAEVALCPHAALAVESAVQGRTEGPLVIDAHGQPLQDDPETEAYARELLTMAAGAPPSLGWSFRRMREFMFEDMADYGVPHHVVMAQAGLGHAHMRGVSRAEMLVQQRAAADWWSYRIGLVPPSPFIVAHALSIEASRSLASVTIERGISR